MTFTSTKHHKQILFSPLTYTRVYIHLHLTTWKTIRILVLLYGIKTLHWLRYQKIQKKMWKLTGYLNSWLKSNVLAWLTFFYWLERHRMQREKERGKKGKILVKCNDPNNITSIIVSFCFPWCYFCVYLIWFHGVFNYLLSLVSEDVGEIKCIKRHSTIITTAF